MSHGPGWLERAILDLLRLNEYLSAPLLAAKAYTAYAPDAPDPPPALARRQTRPTVTQQNAFPSRGERPGLI
jgi:hypothetical protein